MKKLIVATIITLGLCSLASASNYKQTCWTDRYGHEHCTTSW